MSIPDNYEINVAKKRKPEDEYGIHFCKIQLSETLPLQAKEKFEYLKELFGDEYNLSLTHWVCRGEHVD